VSWYIILILYFTIHLKVLWADYTQTDLFTIHRQSIY